MPPLELPPDDSENISEMMLDLNLYEEGEEEEMKLPYEQFADFDWESNTVPLPEPAWDMEVQPFPIFGQQNLVLLIPSNDNTLFEIVPLPLQKPVTSVPIQQMQNDTNPIPEMAGMELEESHDQMEQEQGSPPNAQGSVYVNENQAGDQVFHPPTN